MPMPTRAELFHLRSMNRGAGFDNLLWDDSKKIQIKVNQVDMVIAERRSQQCSDDEINQLDLEQQDAVKSIEAILDRMDNNEKRQIHQMYGNTAAFNLLKAGNTEASYTISEKS